MLLINSCKKDNDVKLFDTKKTEELKTWFTNQQSLMVDKGFLSSLQPNWEQVYQSEENGISIFEINCINPNNIIISPRQETQTDSKKETTAELSKVKLLLFVDETGKKWGSYMFITATAGINTNNIHYKLYNELTGNITFFNLEGQFANSYQFDTGTIKNNISLAPKNQNNNVILGGLITEKAFVNGSGNKIMLANVNDCTINTWDVYQERCFIVGEVFQNRPVGGSGKLSSGGTYTSCSWVLVNTFETMTCTSSNENGGYTPPQNGGGAGSNSGLSSNVNNFVLNTTDQTKYPKFTELLKDLKNFVKNDQKVMDALIKWSKLDRNEILKKVEFGKGPEIVVKELVGKYGYFDAVENPNIINLDASWVRGLEQANLLSTRQATAFLLGVTVLHEFVHQARASQGLDRTYEYGTGFENSAFGLEIYADNAGKYSYRFYGK